MWVREAIINVRRVIRWIPIIWRDRWWDSCFLLTIMAAKLRSDSEKYQKDGIACGCDRRAHQMKIAAILCERLSNGGYTTPWDNEAAQSVMRLMKYLDSNTTTLPNGLTVHTTDGYEPDPILRKKSRWAFEREDQMMDQDIEYLCKILKKHLTKWWD